MQSMKSTRSRRRRRKRRGKPLDQSADQPEAKQTCPTKVGRRRVQECTIGGCGKITSFPKLHLIEEHVPAIFAERLKGEDLDTAENLKEDLARTRYTCLTLMAKYMLGPRASLQDLCNHLDRNGLITPGWEVTEIQRNAMVNLCRVQRWEVPEKFCLSPINSLAVLIHWRCLTVIANALSNTTMEGLRDMYARPIRQTPSTIPVAEQSPSQEETEGEIQRESTPEEAAIDLKPLVYAFDSHFHLDRTRHHLKLGMSASVEDIEAMMPVPDQDYIVRVSGGVSVFCDPGTYPTQQEIQQLTSEGYRVVIGACPKNLLSEEEKQHLQELLRVPEVKGLGDVGIDHTVSPHDLWYWQEQQLKELIPYLLPGKVLVLHVRGTHGDVTGLEAYMRCLDILKHELAQDQRIQLHCFSGTEVVVQSWLHQFPNTFFSISGLVFQFNTEQERALKAVPKDRLLLETDAPYFPVRKEYSCSAPHLLDITARRVAEVLGDISMEEVLELTETNGRNLFQ